MTIDLLAGIEAALARPGKATSDRDLDPPISPVKDRLLRPAAVLVGLQPAPSGLNLILTKRAAHLRNHAGQIAFPGGQFDPGETDAVRCALREAREEIGLPEAAARIIGTLDLHETTTGFIITPVLALLETDFRPLCDLEEVEEVFGVPYKHFASTANFIVESRMLKGVQRRYFIIPYGPYYVWGATARILHALAERMTE